MDEDEYMWPNVNDEEAEPDFNDEEEDPEDGPIASEVVDFHVPYMVYLTDDDDVYYEGFNRTENGYIYGLDGNDTIKTRSFGVHVFGGDGDDTLFWLYQPPKLLDGGAGVDTLDLSQLGRGAKVNLGSGEADTFVPLFLPHRPVEIRNIENVIGTDHTDNIFGDDQDNVLDGRGGGDYIAGGAGDDTIIGGTSGPGHTLARDVLSGGAGNDTFYFRTAEEGLPARQTDVVMDFEQGSDILAFETAYGFGPITFRPADWSPPADTFTALDPRENYLFVHHTSQPGMAEVTEVSVWLTTGHSHEYAAVTLLGHHDLTAGDFMFV